MIEISALSDLTADELERVQAILKQRYDVGTRGNVIDIGFGVAEKRAKLDAERSDAVCFYVKAKRTPRRLADRIPRTIEIRIKRGKRFVLVKLNSDVILLPPSKVKLTGRRVRHASNANIPATSGAIVVWKIPNNSRLFWGAVTVGHLFHGVAHVPESESRVLIEFAPSRHLPGMLIARSRHQDGSSVDAALILVSKETIVQKGLIPKNVSTQGRRVRSVSDLRLDIRKTGFSVPRTKPLDFLVVRYLPRSRIISQLGELTHVIETRSTLAGTFRVGTSGSLWQIGRQGAAIQHGGLSPRYKTGWGQALASIIAWARKRLALVHLVDESSIDLRFIRAI